MSAPRSHRADIDFVERDGGLVGVAEGGRVWRISRTVTGWRLEFRDHGDVGATFAGVHASVAAAQAEAGR